MSIRSYADAVSTRRTPQSEAIPGSSQVANSGGGFSFAVDDWTRLDRFLVLGSSNGSYYAGERELTVENADIVKRLVAKPETAERAVRRILEISDLGRAPKNDPAVFALAIALKHGTVEARRLASEEVRKVCRIGTHIFQLAEVVKALGGWGRNTKRSFENWYQRQSDDALALQLIKYQNRGGWSHRDLLRKMHLKPTSPERAALYKWAAGKGGHSALSKRVEAFDRAKTLTDPKDIVRLVRDFDLPRECLPTEALNHAEVWEALLSNMGATALVRNLAKMTEVGLLKPLSSGTKLVCEKLSDAQWLKASRLHPLALLLAASVYRTGHGLKGSLTWTPVQEVLSALDSAFYAAFGNVAPTGLRWLLAIDISGSMDLSNIAGTSLTAREGAAALALVTASIEKQHHMVAFTAGLPSQWSKPGQAQHYRYGPSHPVGDGLQPFSFSSGQRLGEIIAGMKNLPMGGTDCALPMIYATEQKLEVDVFVVLTDSETWAGAIHPTQALREYRQKSGIAAKSIVVGMVANAFSIADPNDAGQMDVVGMDASAPQLMADFARG